MSVSIVEVRHRVVAADGYAESRAAVATTPATEQRAATLERLAATRPEGGDRVTGTVVRIVRVGRDGELPPLRLYYSVDATAVRFLRIEEYDETEP